MCGYIHFSSIDKILIEMCSGGDVAVVFGCEIYLFLSHRFRGWVKSNLAIILTLCS